METNHLLLASIAPKLGTATEDIATEALAHILSSSKVAMSVVEKLLQASDADEDITIRRVETQSTGKQGERPDVVGFDDQDEKRLLIEAKFGAGLTENQPNGYLDSLPDDGPSALLFVVPENRIESLWPKARDLAGEKFCLDSQCESAATTGNFRRVWIKDTNCQLSMTSWRMLLEDLLAAVKLAGETHAQADIAQLQSLAERMDSERFLPMRAEEFGPDFPRRLLGLNRLIDEATNHAVSAGWVNLRGLQATSLATGYGRYLRLAGVYSRLDINISYWANRRETPLWLELYNFALSDDPEECEKRRREIHRVLEASGFVGKGAEPGVNGGLLIPIHLPIGVEYEDILNRLVENIESIGEIIDPNGPTYQKDSSDA